MSELTELKIKMLDAIRENAKRQKQVQQLQQEINKENEMINSLDARIEELEKHDNTNDTK